MIGPRRSIRVDTQWAEAAAFAAIVESSQYAVIAKEIDGTVTAWSPGATELYGFTAEQMIGRKVDITFAPKGADEERRRHVQVAAGEPESGYRCTRVRADGQPVEVVMTLSPMRDEYGRVVGVASISRRISAAEQDEARFAALLEAAPDAIVCVQRGGRIEALNRQAGTMFGYDRDALLGADAEVLIPDARARIQAEPLSSFVDGSRIRTAAGIALVGRRQDGSTFPVEVNLSPGTAGGDGLIIAAIRDVTGQRLAEAEMRENETRLRQLTDSVDLHFFLYQRDPPAFLYASPGARRIIGGDPNDLLQAGQGSAQLVHPDDRTRVEDAYLAESRAGRAASSEHRIVVPDGTVRWVRVVATPVPNPHGPVERMVMTMEDISARIAAAQALREAESAARAANDAKTRFLSRMSHELRTPLNAVLGFGQILGRQLQGTEHAESVGHVLKGGRHLLELIDDVLDIARIDSGQLSISLEPSSVQTLVGETAELMRPLAASAGIDLHTVAGPAEATAMADRRRLRQILVNLLSNAIKYNHRGGSVWIGWQGDERTSSISVRDDGKGIAAHLHSRLFTAFDRLGVESSGVDGTGIGLALARSLAESMNGSIEVESSVGNGSCFTVTLPSARRTAVGRIGAPDPPGTTMDVGVEHPGPPLREQTVLYIEDNEPNVQVFEHLLALNPGWKLIHAGLGRLGIELARAHQPDLVLLDLHLPDLNGREVLTALKSDPVTASIPVAILSADANPGQPARLLEAGADWFVTKPFDLDAVFALLDDVAAGRSVATPADRAT